MEKQIVRMFPMFSDWNQRHYPQARGCVFRVGETQTRIYAPASTSFLLLRWLCPRRVWRGCICGNQSSCHWVSVFNHFLS